MISALEVLRVMAESNRSLSDLASGFVRYPQILLNIRVASKPPLDSIEPIKTAIAAVENELGNNGRLLVRYSGTENLARVMIEGQDEISIRHQAESLAQLIKERIG